MKRMTTVMIVDDQSAMRSMLKRALDLHGGFSVREASNGRSALKDISASPPDIVIMDLSMPGMTGLELLAQLQRSAITPKVLVLSGSGNYAPEVRAAGGDMFLPKTTSAATLVEKVLSLTEPEAQPG